MSPIRSSFAALSLSALAFGAQADTPSGGFAFGEPAPASRAGRTVEITLGDMFYRPSSLDVQAGETVRFVLKNEGSVLHEFNLGTAALHARHQQEMLKMQQDGLLTPTAMKPGGHMSGHGMERDPGAAPMHHDDPNSVLVEPGKTAELTWTFKNASGLEFACNVPGHYQAGMVGRLSVRPN